MGETWVQYPNTVIGWFIYAYVYIYTYYYIYIYTYVCIYTKQDIPISGSLVLQVFSQHFLAAGAGGGEWLLAAVSL